MKLYYVANARMPSEKAHAIQIAKMCEAFIEAGVDLTLVVPNRRHVKKTPKEFYSLRVDIPVVYLPTVDLVSLGGYVFQAASFALSSFLYLTGKKGIIYTVDMDTFSSSLLPLTGLPVYTEMHNGKPAHLFQRMLFKRVKGVITVNRFLKEDLQTKFPDTRAAYLVEPNGVDTTLFSRKEKAEARTRLSLPNDAKIALYIGRFFDWKGLEIIPEAARLLPDVTWHLVGGSEEAFRRVTGKAPEKNMLFVADVPQTEVPWWCAAADALLVLGTERDTQSWRYTSPMKLFEYLYMERPVVATATPAIQEIVSAADSLLIAPGDPKDLAEKVATAIKGGEGVTRMVGAARVRIDGHTWKARAKRILAFMS